MPTKEQLRKYLPDLLLAAEIGGVFTAVLKALCIDFADLRRQTIHLADAPAGTEYLTAAGLTLLLTLGAFRAVRNDRKTLAIANLPLAGLLLLLLLPMNFPLLLAVILLFALAVWRTAENIPFQLPEISRKNALLFLAAAAGIYALSGAYFQQLSLSKSALQWLDWGHYFEILNNFSKGRPFELNISGGSYLGSRFCPGMIVLLPVVWLQNPFCFFLAGNLAVASGAIAVYLLAKQSRCSDFQALTAGIWYLLIPGIANISLPLLDGFHEVMLLFPGVLFAAVCFRYRYFKSAALLVLFCFTIRETVGFMFLLYGVVLFFTGKRRSGLILAAGSLVLLAVIFGSIMPYFRAGNNGYYHVVFFSHLGNSIPELILSPFLKSRVFFSALFSWRNAIYLASLLLPFLFMLRKQWLWLLPMMPDLIMVMLDKRIDSQTLLRHYQTVMLLVLIIAAMIGLRHIRNKDQALFSSLAAAVVSSVFFVQLPMLPAGDKRLLQWENTANIIRSFEQHIPQGTVLLAGPRLASHFVMRNELFIILSPDMKIPPESQYCLLESFDDFHGESTIRKRLLESRRWKLIHSRISGQRLMQLYKKEDSVVPAVKLPLSSEVQFARLGTPIPSADPAIGLRGNIAGKTLRIFCRINRKIDYDFALLVKIQYAGKGSAEYFFPCGNGVLPGCFIEEGGTWHAAIPLEDVPQKCQVVIVR